VITETTNPFQQYGTALKINHKQVTKKYNFLSDVKPLYWIAWQAL